MIEYISIAASITRLIDWVKKLLEHEPIEDVAIADRFLMLFEKHGIHRNQIPRFFDHGITVNDVSDSEKLLNKLDVQTMQAACDIFQVNLEWLEGAGIQIYPVHHVYKQPEKFREFLNALIKQEHQTIHFQLYISHDAYDDEALFVIHEPIAKLSNEIIYKHHVFGGWEYSYYKCRADIAACVAMADKHKLYIDSVCEKNASLAEFSNGNAFIEDLSHVPVYLKRKKWLRRTYEPWYPDELLTNPAKLVADLRDGEWGKSNVIDRWLYYYDQGYMDTDMNDVSRDSFANYLNINYVRD